MTPAAGPAGNVLPRNQLARLLSRIQAGDHRVDETLAQLPTPRPDAWVVGITGPPGAGKSTLTSALVTQLRRRRDTVAVLAVDPSSPLSGGAVLGDRVRMMEHLSDDGVFIRSLASRGQTGGLSAAVPQAVSAMLAHGYDRVLLETVGIGQGEIDVVDEVDTTMLVLAPGMGDAVQAIKAGVLEVADILVVNKGDRDGARQTARDLKIATGRQPYAGSWSVPVILTVANDGGGVDEVCAAIDDHRRCLGAAGAIEERRSRRRVLAWRALCRRLLLGHLEDSLASDLAEQLAGEIAAGGLTGFEAAMTLLAAMATSTAPRRPSRWARAPVADDRFLPREGTDEDA